MNLMKKMIFTFTVLGIANAIQPAEPPQNNIDKVFFYFSRITNHTNKDLFIYKWDEQLLTLKAGETLKNIPIQLADDRQFLIIKDQNKKLGSLSMQFCEKQFLDKVHDAVVIRFSTKSLEICEKWEEQINLDSYKRLEIGIHLDLKGDQLFGSEMDVIANAK